jgi:NitT/TauT family transport system substrate-binding protein
MKFILAFIFFTSSWAFAQKVQLGLNWKPEPQFGGFYAAQEKGEFKKRGLDVTILEGGSGTPTVQMLVNKKLAYAIVSAEEIILSQDRNPKSKVVAVFATYQTYPCMIMSHAERGFQKLADVFSHEGTLSMQSGLPYYQFLQSKYGPFKVKVVPYLGGIVNFMNDPLFSQQGFITSEPLSAAKAGVKVKTFMIADEGFNPYTTVLAVHQDYLKQHSDEVRRFVEAVRAGWQDYLKDPASTNEFMARLNKSMTLTTFKESAEAQKKLIETAETRQKSLGFMSEGRWTRLVEQIHQLKLIRSKPRPQDLYKNID